MQNSGAVGFEERFAVLAPRVHAGMAELVELSARLDTDGSWATHGMQTCAHWLSMNIGVGVWTGAELVRVGHALEKLPEIRAAFAAGELSFDKVRALSRVAKPEDQQHWLQVARGASGGQLARICREVRIGFPADDPRRAGDPLLKRGVHAWYRDDGMLQLLAVLPAEEGAIVMAALERAEQVIRGEQRSVPSPDEPELAAERRTRPMLRADALNRVCEAWVGASAQTPAVAPTTQVVVHVDEGVLTGADPDGRSHIEDGPWVSPSSVRRMSCDADVVTVTERSGNPIDVGRIHRLITPKLRLALQSRDQGCRFPGCSVPATRTDGHHVKHWADGGATNLDNLVSLCRFHHGRHHEGKFLIVSQPSGVFQFVRADGNPIAPADNNSGNEFRDAPDWGLCRPGLQSWWGGSVPAP